MNNAAWRCSQAGWACLALLLAATAADAAVETGGRTVTYQQLVPDSDNKFSHEYYYQVPDSPRGVVALFHGCVGSGSNYWPQSAACAECRGMPEQMSHTLQALRRGYAVIAVSSMDRDTGCWNFDLDSPGVAALIPTWMRDWGLDGLPLYGMGISSGGSFALKIPRLLKFDGVTSEALAVEASTWGLDKMDGDYPPTVFVNMVLDTAQQPRYKEDISILRDQGTPAEEIKVYSRRVYPTYFSDRSPYYITPAFSREIAVALNDLGMIDDEGWVNEDPRQTERPWLDQLKTYVPALGGTTMQFNGRTVPTWFDDSTDVNAAGVYSLMNLAYAEHEIISDYFTAILMWFESGGSADLPTLVDQYTYGLPPPAMANYVYSAPPPPSPHPPPPPKPKPPSPHPPKRPPPSKPPPASPPSPAPGASDEELMQLAGATDSALPPQAQSGTWDSISASLAGGPAASPPEEATSSSNLAAIIGAVVGGVLGGVVTATLIFYWARRRRARVRATSPDAVADGDAKLAIHPSIKDLTEVVDATGSPHSARRRARTVFNSGHRDSPTRSRSPQKRGMVAP